MERYVKKFTTYNHVVVMLFAASKGYHSIREVIPFTMENGDPANNILDDKALIEGFPASGQGQLDYLNRLKAEIKSAGGEGLIYWEPAWVSTECNTLWGQGSHWDNATLFDHNYKATLGMEFYNCNIN